MASVTLAKADLALLSSLATRRVTLPHLVAATPQRSLNGTTVRFAGDVLPTPFRGEGGTRTWDLTVRFAATEGATLKQLLDLFEDAAEAADSRLLLRTHYGQAAGLDQAAAVIVLGYQPTPQRGVYTDVQFTATAVQWTAAV